MENQPQISERELAEKIIWLHDYLDPSIRKIVGKLRSGALKSARCVTGEWSRMNIYLPEV